MVARYWRRRRQFYRLVGEVCQNCGAEIFPPRDICPECRQQAGRREVRKNANTIDFNR